MTGGSQRDLFFKVGFGINDRPLTQADRQVDSFKNNVIRATDRMGALERKAVTAGRAMSSAFHDVKNAMGRGIALLERYRYQLGLIASAGFGAIVKSVFNAGDAQETVNKFNVVFGEVADSTRKWADEYSQDIGRSKYATLDWLNSFQDVLVPMGLARDEAAGLSKDMVTLAADLGSFNNVGTAAAADAMQSALMGNHRAVKNLGTQLNEANLNARAAAMGYKESFRQLDSLAKMQIRYQEIIAQNQDAIGDAVRTSDEWNNQIQRFKGNIRDTSIAVGKVFKSAFLIGLIAVNKFIAAIKQSEKLQAGARFFAIGVAITGIASAIGMVSAAWPAIAGLFSISTFGIVAAITGVVLVLEDLWVGLNGGESTLLPIINKFLEWAGINKDLKGVLRDVGDAALWTWEAIKASFAYIEPLVQSTVIGAVKIFEGAFKILSSPIKAVSGIIKGVVTGDFGMYMDAVDQFYSGVADIFEGIKTIVTAKLTFIGNLFLDIFKLSKIPDIAGAIKEKIIAAANYVKDNPLKIVRFLVPAVNLPDIINKIYESGRQFIKDKTGIELPEIKLPTLPDLVGAVKDIWNSGKTFINNLKSQGFPEVKIPTIESIKNKAAEKWNSFTGWLSGIKEKHFPDVNIPEIGDIKVLASNKWNQFTSWFNNLKEKHFPDVKLPTIPDLLGSVKSTWNNAKSFVDDLIPFDLPGLSMPDIPDPIAKIDEWASSIKSKLSNIDFGSALKTAIENAMDQLPGWMQGMAKKVMDYLPQSPAKVGPLSRLDKVGPGLTQTIGKGVDKSREQVTGPLSNMWTESMIAEPKTIVKDYNPMSSISDSGFGNSKSVTTNNYNNSNSQQQRSVKKVDKIEINIQDSGDSKQTAIDVRKEIEKYFDMEATSSVGEATG
jgi:hypothetical protein